MGVSVLSATVASKTIESDDDPKLDGVGLFAGGVPAFVFTTLGSGPAASLTTLRGGVGHFRCRITTGGTSTSAAANNINITCLRAVRKVFMAQPSTTTPGWYVNNLTGVTFDVGSKTNPAISTAYDFEFIVLF